MSGGLMPQVPQACLRSFDTFSFHPRGWKLLVVKWSHVHGSDGSERATNNALKSFTLSYHVIETWLNEEAKKLIFPNDGKLATARHPSGALCPLGSHTLF